MNEDESALEAGIIRETIIQKTNTKKGKDKLPVHLVPPSLLEAAARPMEEGASKYGPFNWRYEPIRLTHYLAAIDRHSGAIKRGEDIDPDSGLPHIDKIIATAGIIKDAEEWGTLIDDREIPIPASTPERYVVKDHDILNDSTPEPSRAGRLDKVPAPEDQLPLEDYR